MSETSTAATFSLTACDMVALVIENLMKQMEAQKNQRIGNFL